MSSTVYSQDFDGDPFNPPARDAIANSLEQASKEIREQGQAIIYLGGSVHVYLDLGPSRDAGINVEA